MRQSNCNQLSIERPKHNSEIDQMVAVRVLSAQTAYSRPEGPDMQSVRNHYEAENNTIKTAIESDTYQSLCAKSGSLVVGMCVWSVTDESYAAVKYLYVLPTWQGMGIGGCLLDQALDEIGSVETVELTTQNAQTFYEKWGFERTGRFVTDEITSEEIMVKRQ